jgi:hypothetical protein
MRSPPTVAATSTVVASSSRHSKLAVGGDRRRRPGKLGEIAHRFSLRNVRPAQPLERDPEQPRFEATKARAVPVADLHRDHRRDREAGLPNELDVRRGHLLHGAEPLPLSRLELHLAFLAKAHA